jgi:peptidyl-prolyl cis-trans isomerase SurA
MKKKIIILVLFLSFNLFNKVVAKIENKIVIKVENEIITNFEIKNKIISSLLIAGEEINQENINKYKKSIVNTLIDNKLKKIEVSRYKIKRNDAKIKSYINNLSTEGLTLERKFLDNNLDFQLYEDEISTEFKWQTLIYKIYSNKIQIDENSINIEMNNFINNSSDVEEFKISEIEVSLNNNQEYENKILEIEAKIKEDGFEKTALKYNDTYSASQKGNLGWINSKSLSNDIYKLLNQMKKGEVSRPVKRQNSIIFLKLNDKRISKTNNLNLTKLKEDLMANKKNEQFDLYSRSHLSKIRNMSLIEYK